MVSDGQIKIIINISTGGTNNVVITPTNLRGYTTITLNAKAKVLFVYLKIQTGM